MLGKICSNEGAPIDRMFVLNADRSWAALIFFNFKSTDLPFLMKFCAKQGDTTDFFVDCWSCIWRLTYIAAKVTTTTPSSLPSKQKIFCCSRCVVEATMRNLVGWVGSAVWGQETYQIPHRRPLQGGRKRPCLSFASASYFMTAKSKKDSGSAWREQNSGWWEFTSVRCPDIREKKSVTRTKNWLGRPSPKKILWSRRTYNIEFLPVFLTKITIKIVTICVKITAPKKLMFFQVSDVVPIGLRYSTIYQWMSIITSKRGANRNQRTKQRKMILLPAMPIKMIHWSRENYQHWQWMKQERQGHLKRLWMVKTHQSSNNLPLSLIGKMKTTRIKVAIQRKCL